MECLHKARAPETAPVLAPILAIGASTGGPTAVAQVLAGLPEGLNAAVLVVQHLDQSFSTNLASWLSSQTALAVVLAEPGDKPQPGRVYVAKGGDHLVLTPWGVLQYCREPRKTLYRPSVDVLFGSLADTRGARGVAVLLTGMGYDGAKGLLALRRAGWFTIAQDKDTSAVYGMPRAARDLDAADLILPLPDIAAVAAKHLPDHD
jgi:two-component system response regulator WspF